MTFISLALAIALLGDQTRTTSPANDLATAKALYATANYEEALSQLNALRKTEEADQVDQYRALCLLALGRTSEAERTLEELITRRPQFAIKDSEVSPRLVSMFHDVRARVLPSVAKGLYAKARTNYDRKWYGEAAPQFKELLAILADTDVPHGSPTLADLKILAEGFSRLIDLELGTPNSATVVWSQPSPALNAPAAPPSIYTSRDRGVTPPVEVDRRVPQWLPPTDGRGDRVWVEIVIDELGVVESSVIRKSVSVLYDRALLEAVKLWKFRPAIRAGQAVKYRTIVEILLR